MINHFSSTKGALTGIAARISRKFSGVMYVLRYRHFIISGLEIAEDGTWTAHVYYAGITQHSAGVALNELADAIMGTASAIEGVESILADASGAPQSKPRNN